MAHSAGVTWTCDRCRRPVTTETGGVPEGWKFIVARPMGTSPLGANQDGKDREWEICGTCYTQHVERVLMNGQEPPEEITGKPWEDQWDPRKLSF